MSTDKESRYLSMPPTEIVKALCTHAQAGSQLHEEIKGALSAVLTKNLTDSIDRHEKAASVLSTRLLWLNIILGAFTVVGTVLAVVAFIQQAS